jgi:hypothetical protein
MVDTREIETNEIKKNCVAKLHIELEITDKLIAGGEKK